MSETEDGIRCSVSLSQKVNLGNYERAEVFMSLSNVPADATVEDINAALDAGKIVYDALRQRMRIKVAAARESAR